MWLSVPRVRKPVSAVAANPPPPEPEPEPGPGPEAGSQPALVPDAAVEALSACLRAVASCRAAAGALRRALDSLPGLLAESAADAVRKAALREVDGEATVRVVEEVLEQARASGLLGAGAELVVAEERVAEVRQLLERLGVQVGVSAGPLGDGDAVLVSPGGVVDGRVLSRLEEELVAVERRVAEALRSIGGGAG